MTNHTHNLFFAPLFSDECDAHRIPLSLQDADDFDVSVFSDNIDHSAHNSADWHLVDCQTGAVVACSSLST